MPICLSCKKLLSGRSDKKFCDQYCKSSYHYSRNKSSLKLFNRIDRQLKINRKILKAYNKKGLTTVRRQELEKEGFNPHFFSHFWKNPSGQVYFFCYEYGFLKLDGIKKGKLLLVQSQPYMLRHLGSEFIADIT